MTLLLALACGDEPGPTGTPPTTIPPTTGLPDLLVTPSAVIPSVVQVSWTSEAGSASWVTYGLSSPDEQATPEVVATTSAQAVRIVGLKAGRTYRWVAHSRLPDGTAEASAEGELTVAAPPAGLPLPTVAVSTAEARVPTGFVATTLVDATGGWAVVLDGEGEVVWWYDTGHAGAPPHDLLPFVPPDWDGATLPLTSRIDPATGSLLVQFYDAHQRADVATLRRIPLDAMQDTEIETTRTTLGHHDFRVDSAGTVGYLGYEVATVDGAAWASDVILETAEGNQALEGRHPVWSWLDDFPVAPSLFDPLQEAFSIPSLAEREWTHSNSLLLDEPSHSWFVLSKFLDCLVRVDRDTGALQWVLGGPYSDFTLPGGEPVWTALGDTALWSHGHLSDLWYDAASGTGGFAVFDNGYYYPSIDGVLEGWSRVSEYAFDEQARTVEKVWEHVPADGPFTPLMGDVRRLDDGYLVGWSSLGHVDELAPDGTVRWRIDLPGGITVGRVSWYESLQPGSP